MRDVVQVWLRPEVYDAALKAAALDHVDVPTLIEDLVRRHASYVNGLGGPEQARAAFDLTDYEMQRDPGESDEEFEARLSLFR